jgi:hypothetical protein
MANWNPPPDSRILTGKPVLASDIRAIRDLAEAQAEAAIGAPKTQIAAMQPPTAGTAYLLKTIQSAPASTTVNVYPDPGFHDRYDSEQHLGFSCLLPGVITVQVEHHAFGPSGSLVRLLQNGVEIIEWTTYSVPYVQQSYDLPIASGDAVIVQMRTSPFGGISTWQNLQVYSGTQSAAVA